MAESSHDDILSWEDLIYIADLYVNSGEKRFRILGGEPTLHPDFNDMLIYLLERDFDITVFTSGIMTDRLLNEMAVLFTEVHPERLTFICNMNDPEKTRTSLAEAESVNRFLRTFGERVIPGFNIYRKDFSLDFLLRAVNEFGLRRNIRLGIAHPIVGKKNLFIPLAEIDGIIERIFSYVPLFERLRIKPGLDCGFPLCRFTDAQLAWLYRFTGRGSEFTCGPPLDIGPDLSVWPCFPLSSFRKRSLYEFTSLRELSDYYLRFHDIVRVEVGGIMKECDLCRLREDRICMGGCMAHNLVHFQKEARVRMEEVYL